MDKGDYQQKKKSATPLLSPKAQADTSKTGGSQTSTDTVSYSPANVNTSDKTFSDKVVSSMSMSDCSEMIRRVFNADIRDYYEGEYKTADDWLKATSVDDVAFYIGNNESVYQKYLSKIQPLQSGMVSQELADEFRKKRAIVG